MAENKRRVEEHKKTKQEERKEKERGRRSDRESEREERKGRDRDKKRDPKPVILRSGEEIDRRNARVEQTRKEARGKSREWEIRQEEKRKLRKNIPKNLRPQDFAPFLTSEEEREDETDSEDTKDARKRLCARPQQDSRKRHSTSGSSKDRLPPPAPPSRPKGTTQPRRSVAQATEFIYDEDEDRGRGIEGGRILVETLGKRGLEKFLTLQGNAEGAQQRSFCYSTTDGANGRFEHPHARGYEGMACGRGFATPEAASNKAYLQDRLAEHRLSDDTENAIRKRWKKQSLQDIKDIIWDITARQQEHMMDYRTTN